MMPSLMEDDSRDFGKVFDTRIGPLEFTHEYVTRYPSKPTSSRRQGVVNEQRTNRTEEL
jgi:hypothetical protein